jgi:hypothetical protein
MPSIKTRPSMPRFDDLYTGVTDDSFARIQASTRIVSEQAKALRGESGEQLQLFDDNYDRSETAKENNYEFGSEEERKLASVLSREAPEAELHAGEHSFYLYPEYGSIMGVNRRDGSVFVNTYDYEDDLEAAWDEAMQSTRRREI